MTAPRRYVRSESSRIDVLAPGDVLALILDATGRTQADFARAATLTTKHVNQVVQGKASVSVSVAKTFEIQTGVPARLWLALEAHYQLSRQAEG
jgi:HTH-type transcriptional regulator/antitoxin HigA